MVKARLNLRIDADLKRRLEEVSIRKGVSMSSLVEELIVRGLTHPRGEYIILECSGCGRRLLIDGRMLEVIKKEIRKNWEFYCRPCVEYGC